MSLSGEVWAGFDPAQGTGLPTASAVVTRIFDRWKMHDFWLVEYEAFDPVIGGYVRDSEAFDRKVDAFQFRPGRCVNPGDSLDEVDDLPF